jgi:hypothetical protein
METLPGKKPLIKLAYRPPNSNPYWIISRTQITPNDEFFVRYHLSGLPETIDQYLQDRSRRRRRPWPDRTHLRRPWEARNDAGDVVFASVLP